MPKTRLLAALFAFLWIATPALAATLKLERVVLVERHGVRPPTQSNEALAKYAAQPWPAWPVAPGELTPHGGQTVQLMGDTLRARYVSGGLLPARGCPDAASLVVWADGTDQRTRRTGEILIEALAPGCQAKAAWGAASPRDPIFGGSSTEACKLDADKARAALAAAATGPEESASLTAAFARLQVILAPKACAGGPGTCFAPASTGAPAAGDMAGPFPATAALAEDLLLEYVDDKPMSDVGWGRASARDIAAVMPIHERAFALIRDATYVVSRRGAVMGRVVLAGLAGSPVAAGPTIGPDVKVLAFAGHDSDLMMMAGVFGLRWANLAGQPDGTAPATTLAFEVWSDPATGARYVRPALYYETLDQLRTLKPALASRLDLRFDGCASGPGGSCPLNDLHARVEALIPPGCGEL
ncbi:MAG: histidine-type phosphatase [Caulobacterales bacterium]